MKSAIDRSLEAFERLHDVHVTIHDLDGSLAGVVDISHTRHRHPLCAQIKAGSEGARCYRFEVADLRPQLQSLKAGRIHRCHAGLVECMMPVWGHAQTLRAVLFVGPRSWQGPLNGLHDFQSRSTRVDHKLKGLDSHSAPDLLEAAAQLAARIAQHLDVLPERTKWDPQDRKASLEWLLYHHSAESLNLGDLAQLWGVTRSRATHIVRELTGSSWRNLLLGKRLRMASHLLRHTDLSLEIIAERSGFPDRTALGRAFHKQFNTSPGQWRRARES